MGQISLKGNFLMVLAIIAGAQLISCGYDEKSSASAEIESGEVASAFLKTAELHGIPIRVLKAVAFAESGMSPRPASSRYKLGGTISIPMAETAFGLPMTTLGLDPQDRFSMTLSRQVEAYGLWLADRLRQMQLTLYPLPSNAAEIYDWIKQISMLHRNGLETRRNIQTLFAYELMDKLNAGDRWQDPNTGEVLTLEPEVRSLALTDFPDEIQQNLKIYSHDGDIFYADYFELTFQPKGLGKNTPSHIRIIHCPLSLSACLELQSSSAEQTVRLDAHYVIPPLSRNGEGSNVFPLDKALQVAQHQTALSVTNASGEIELVDDAIVIMLVGSSGRYSDGVRIVANPKWFTKPQLEIMGKIIRSVCPLMKQLNNDINMSTCLTPGNNKGVRFSTQGISNNYRWGDIPDFDFSIFETYVLEPDKLEGEAIFAFRDSKKVYRAGETIDFDMKFIRGATRVVIEYLGRCSDSKLVWSIKNSYSVRNSNTESFQFKLFRQGANFNGRHFFRSLIYKEKALVGWAIEDIHLLDFDQDRVLSADARDCGTKGS